MKVFWSWQSDHDGKISHYLIRDALEAAIEKLKLPKDIEEPSEAERRANLELDHDTKGETGWTDIADSIFKKIDNSAVFVADVTPVGRSRSGNGRRKPIMNPNVAIELGYAIKALTWSSCLGVMNLAYGKIDDLPFDIHRTRSWPVTYSLKEGATKENIDAAKKGLAEAFFLKLRPILSKATEQSMPGFERVQPARPPAFWFAKGRSVGVRGTTPYTMPYERALFLRVIPTTAPKLISHEKAGHMASKYGSFDEFGNLYILRNEDGAATCELSDDIKVESIAQYFCTGEVWGINAVILRNGESRQFNYMDMAKIEELFRKKLPVFIEAITHDGRVKLPITVVGGVMGVKGWSILFGGVPVSGYSRMIKGDVVHERTLNVVDQPALDEYLLGLFEAIFEASGKPRPDSFNGFPR
ncbi:MULTISPECIES: hypothetical protein [unclassified Bradyrhizobium]|uniref:hypothetical protein n=1 Tax=unclassified Bradyrhizobium TaxID=2631580 RepID=UPI0029170538|nr:MULTISPECIES: hypothetical protein [unclassified Bradyrhizobium]